MFRVKVYVFMQYSLEAKIVKDWIFICIRWPGKLNSLKLKHEQGP
jgi:hypothetical protein